MTPQGKCWKCNAIFALSKKPVKDNYKAMFDVDDVNSPYPPHIDNVWGRVLWKPLPGVK